METTLRQFRVFDCLQEQVDCIVEATRLVRSGVSRDTTGTVSYMERILELECKGNQLLHRSLRNVDMGSSQSIPCSKADLHRVFWQLDGVLSAIERLATRVLAYRMTEFAPAVVRLGDIATSCGAELPGLVDAAGNGKPLTEAAARIYVLHEEARSALLQAMTELFESERDAIQLMKNKDIHESLGEIVDAFEDATSAIEDMMLKSL